MPITSPFGNYLYGLPESDIWSFLFHRKDRRAPNDKVLFQDADYESHNYTYGEVREASLGLGKALKARYRIRRGDVIAIVSGNDIDYPSVTLGALWAGAVVSPVNPGYTLTELIHQLKDSEAKMVVTQLSTINVVCDACAAVGIPSANILLMGVHTDPHLHIKHWNSLHALASGFIHQPIISPKEDLAFIVYSSGTTGAPKGVELTHYNITSNLIQVHPTELAGINSKGSDNHVPGIKDAPPSGDTMLTFIPFYHIYGLLHTALGPLFIGVRCVVMPQFKLEKWCSAISHYKVTVAYIVPPIALYLSKHPIVDHFDLSSLRMIVSGAAPMTKELILSVYKRTGIPIKQGYGLTETSPTAFAQRWQDWRRSIGSTGKLLPNMEAKICVVRHGDEHSKFHAREVRRGEVGELFLRGPNVFKGYHGHEAATRNVLSKDGWFRTGDVGYFSEHGDLYITDRVKELIRCKGFQIPPAELEGYLTDHDLVVDAAVVGVDSQVHGTEVPRAYVVRKGGVKAVKEGDAEALERWFARRVGVDHKRLRGGVVFVDSIPKNSSGKLLRRRLREQARRDFKSWEEETIKAETIALANL